MASPCVSTALVPLIKMQHENGECSWSSPVAIELRNALWGRGTLKKSPSWQHCFLGQLWQEWLLRNASQSQQGFCIQTLAIPKVLHALRAICWILLQQVHRCAAKKTHLYTWLQRLQFKLEGTTLGPQNVEPRFFSCKHPAVGGVDIISSHHDYRYTTQTEDGPTTGWDVFQVEGFACSIWGLAVWPWHYHHISPPWNPF